MIWGINLLIHGHGDHERDSLGINASTVNNYSLCHEKCLSVFPSIIYHLSRSKLNGIGSFNTNY